MFSMCSYSVSSWSTSHVRLFQSFKPGLAYGNTLCMNDMKSKSILYPYLLFHINRFPVINHYYGTFVTTDESIWILWWFE